MTTLQLLVTREAASDISEAITYLEGISPSLTVRFEQELERVFATVIEYPQIYPQIYKRFRRALVRRFPYSVFYTIEPTLILIVGVVHQAKDESTWKRRA